MTQFAQAFGSKFNKDDLRVRSFEMNGHTFKVKVPLTMRRRWKVARPVLQTTRYC